MRTAFGRKLERMLVAKDLTGSELARRVNLTRQTVASYLSGRVFPSETKMAELAEVLGVDVKDLFDERAMGAAYRPRITDEIDVGDAGGEPAFRATAMPGADGVVKLSFDQAVSLDTFVQIVGLLDKDRRSRQS